MPKIADVLALEDVSLARRGRVVLDGIRLSVREGEVVIVEGARGAGKSQLLGIAAAVLRPQAGAVRVGGRNILALQAASLPYVRRNIGYLPPEPALIEHETVHENVLVPLAIRGVPVREAEARADHALGRMNLLALRDEPVESLSPSERRLVAIARALIGAPVAIVLDEPGGGLDGDSRTLVAEAITAARASGAAILCASADPTFVALLQARGAVRLTLEGGRLHGAPARMMVVEGGAPLAGVAAVPAVREPTGDIELDEADLEALRS